VLHEVENEAEAETYEVEAEAYYCDEDSKLWSSRLA